MMVVCGCGKVLDRVPAWLAGVKVEFVCNNCPRRQVKNISELSIEAITGRPPEEAKLEPPLDEAADLEADLDSDED